MASGNVFSASEMLTALRGGNFAPSLKIVCAIKHEDKNDKHLLINTRMSCVDWIPIPLETIDTIEYVRKFTCDDHSHPIVKLTFAPPKTPEGQAFAAIAAQFLETFAYDEVKLPADGYPECAACLNNCTDTFATSAERRACYQGCPC
jgi:hypothetical protein